MTLPGFSVDNGGFAGYVSIYGVEDEGGDTVLPGAFSGGLDYFRQSPLVLWDHDTSRPVGIASVADDGIGLWTAAKFLGTADGQMARQVVTETKQAGAPYGLSFGYSVPDRGAMRTPDGRGRLLRRLKLLEVSLVSLPMNRLARVRAVKYTAAEAAELERQRYLQAAHLRHVIAMSRRVGVRV